MINTYPETWAINGYLINEWQRNGHDLAVYEIKEISFLDKVKKVDKEFFAVIDGFKIRGNDSIFVKTLDAAVELANSFADKKNGGYKLEQ